VAVISFTPDDRAGSNMTIVNVALPSIQQELDVPPTNLEWILNAYTLVLASHPRRRRARPHAGDDLVGEMALAATSDRHVAGAYQSFELEEVILYAVRRRSRLA
jgi:hypothetical protein